MSFQATAQAVSGLLVGMPKSGTCGHQIDNMLRSTIETSVEQLLQWLVTCQGSLETPALASRRLLESATFALLARVDPLRVMYVWRAQNSGKYDLERRNKIALQWSGDIFPSGSNDRVNKDVTGQSEPRLIERCLFGDPQKHIVWTPAFQFLFDEWSNIPNQNSWQIDALKTPAENFLQKCTSPISIAYSALSKSIHLESLIQQELISINDLKVVTGDSVKALAHCGAALSAVATSRAPWSMRDIYDKHCQVEATFGAYSS